MPAPTFPVHVGFLADAPRNCLVRSGPDFRVRAAGVTYAPSYHTEAEARAKALAMPPSAFPPGSEERHWAHVREQARTSS